MLVIPWEKLSSQDKEKLLVSGNCSLLNQGSRDVLSAWRMASNGGEFLPRASWMLTENSRKPILVGQQRPRGKLHTSGRKMDVGKYQLLVLLGFHSILLQGERGAGSREV
jgi:hypothetical protein